MAVSTSMIATIAIIRQSFSPDGATVWCNRNSLLSGLHFTFVILSHGLIRSWQMYDIWNHAAYLQLWLQTEGIGVQMTTNDLYGG